jgi:low affinity Fe/Cu permease
MAEKQTSKAVHAASARMTRRIGSPASILFHTLVFVGCFGSAFFDVVSFDRMLLVLTTLVSLEAIYLAIFIQMSINQTTESLEIVEHDIDEIQEDIDEIQEDVDEIQEDVEDITEEEKKEDVLEKRQAATLVEIQSGLQKLMQDVERLQQKG